MPIGGWIRAEFLFRVLAGAIELKGHDQGHMPCYISIPHCANFYIFALIVHTAKSLAL